MNTVAIKAKGGMSNLPKQDDGGKLPAILLNAVFANGKLVKRGGYALALAKTGITSLWAGPTFMLGAGNGKVYDLSAGTAVEILTGVDTSTPVTGCEIAGVSYFGNAAFNAMYQGDNAGSGSGSGDDDMAQAWGAALPVAPTATASATGGTLPAGVYHLCMTGTDALGRIGGGGPMATVTATTDVSSIAVSNASGYTVWCTEPNGSTFFRVTLTGGSITSINTAEPLPSFLCHAPAMMTCITDAHGRVWGASGGTLYFSEPFRPDLWRSAFNKFTFPGTINTVARTVSGLFVGTDVETFSLLGTDPAKMVVTSVGAASIPGSLCYCDSVKDLGDVLQVEEKVHDAVPVWMTTEGIVMGNAVGRLYNLTANKVTLPAPTAAASVFTREDGLARIVMTFTQDEAADAIGAALHTGNLLDAAPAVGSGGAEIIYNTWVLSGQGFAPAIYSGFNFTGYAVFRGVAYAIGAAGLYALGGTTDAGTDIVSGVRWDGLQFGIPGEKRLRGVKAAGTMAAASYIKATDGTRTQTETVDAYNQIKVSRTQHGRDWTLILSDFTELNSVEVELLPRAR